MKRYRRLIERLEARIKSGTEGGVVFEQADGSYLYKGKRLKELPPGNFMIVPEVPGEARTVEGWEAWAREKYAGHRERIEREYGAMFEDRNGAQRPEAPEMPMVERGEEMVFVPGRGWVSVPKPDEPWRPPQRNWK